MFTSFSSKIYKRHLSCMLLDNAPLHMTLLQPTAFKLLAPDAISSIATATSNTTAICNSLVKSFVFKLILSFHSGNPYQE